MSETRKEDGKYIYEDHHGQEYTFKSALIAELFEKVDKLEEGIRDKYFDSDTEFTKGLALVKKMKGQLRRMTSDFAKVETIMKDGVDEEEEE